MAPAMHHQTAERIEFVASRMASSALPARLYALV
jgi:hypothetical protein